MKHVKAWTLLLPIKPYLKIIQINVEGLARAETVIFSETDVLVIYVTHIPEEETYHLKIINSILGSLHIFRRTFLSKK